MDWREQNRMIRAESALDLAIRVFIDGEQPDEHDLKTIEGYRSVECYLKAVRDDDTGPVRCGSCDCLN